MKTKFLTLNKPCDEKWENMTPNERGSFCDSCSKNVIDFTRLSQLEISEIMKKSDGNICARVTRTQLRMPLYILEPEKKKLALPYSNIAAGLMLAAALTAGHPIDAKTPKVETEIVQTLASNIDIKSTDKKTKPKSKKSESSDTIIFEGLIISEVDSLPVENVIISFCTLNKLISTYSNKDGTFSLEIPKNLIDDDNVIKLLYHESREQNYSDDDYILSKEELNEYFVVRERTDIVLLGKIAYTPIPLVFHNGEQIDYDEFISARDGEKNSCNLENKEYYFFDSDAAFAIYGQESRDGLILLVDKPVK